MFDSTSNEDAAIAMQACMEYHASHMPDDNFDQVFLKSVRTRSAQVAAPFLTAKATQVFTIPSTYRNRPFGPKTIHGGAVAMWFDWLTSLAICATDCPGWESLGVTRRLDITYFKPPVEGDVIVVDSEVLSIGKRLATIRGVMKRESDGAILATCQHDKVVAQIKEKL